MNVETEQAEKSTSASVLQLSHIHMNVETSKRKRPSIMREFCFN